MLPRPAPLSWRRERTVVGRGVGTQRQPPPMDTPACATGCGGLRGCTRRGGSPSIALAFYLSPVYPRGQPCHGWVMARSRWQRGALGMQRFLAPGAVSVCGQGDGGFLSRHRDQLRSGSVQPAIPQEMPPRIGMELGCSLRTEPPEEAVGSPSPCFALYSLFFGYRLKPGCWDSGCRGAGPGAPAVLSAVMPVIPPCAGARMPLLGCGQCRAGRAKPFAAPAHPNPRFAGGLRKNAFFVVVETQRQQGLLSGAVGARDLGLPRARRAPTPRMSVVSS